MSNALVHNSFRISNAKQFKESFQELADFGIGRFVPTSSTALTANPTTGSWDVSSTAAVADLKLNDIPSSALDDHIYLFIGRVTPWMSTDTADGTPDPNIDENNPPSPIDSVKHGNFDHWDDMIAAKKVNGSDVSHVVKRERPTPIATGVRGWQVGARYDQYDDRKENLFDDNQMHHVLNDRFRVYKCMKTGIGRFTQVSGYTGGQSGWVWDHKSYDEPQKAVTSGNVSDNHMVPNQDGYQWKFLYTIAAGEALKFVTTSYLPVRTIRQANGLRVNDYSDQYEVETNAINGAILNVVVDKTEEIYSSETVGYEPLGGDGYVQFALSTATATFSGTASSEDMTISFAAGNPTYCLFPGQTGGAPGANNSFDFVSSGTANTFLANSHPSLNLVGYGILFDAPHDVVNYPDSNKYLYPIVEHTEAAGLVTLKVDPNFIQSLATSGVLPNSGTNNWGGLGSAALEVHPRIEIVSNHDSSSANTAHVKDSLQAYAVVEPFFDSSLQYKEKEFGRVIDVRVVNPGFGHRRIDSTVVSPDVSGTANVATVHACVAPVGGHGFDPVAELGGYNVMINARFEGTESDEFSVGNEFRKIGILKNPMSWSANNLWMEADNYNDRFSSLRADQCYTIHLANSSVDSANTAFELAFQSDMNVNFYANTGAAYDTTNTIASATLVDYNADTNALRLIKPRGDFAAVFGDINNKLDDYLMVSADSATHANGYHSVTGNTIQAVANGAIYENPAMKPGSGNILYLENRTTVSRSANQSEDLKVSIQFVDSDINVDIGFKHLDVLSDVAPDFLTGVFK